MLTYTNTVEGGILAAILVGGREFPVHVSASLDMTEGKALPLSGIFIRTADLHKAWPFELIGWLSASREWLRARSYRKARGMKRMRNADDETVERIRSMAVASQARTFKGLRDVGQVMTLREYIDMANVIISHGDQLMGDNMPVYWNCRNEKFDRQGKGAVTIMAILTNMVNIMHTPIVVPYIGCGVLSFNAWFSGFAQQLQDGSEPVPPVEPCCEQLEIAYPEQADSTIEEPDVLPPTTANDTIGVHMDQPFEIEFKMQYTIHIRNPEANTLDYIRNMISNMLVHTRYSCAVDNNTVSVKYHDPDVRPPILRGTNLHDVADFPVFADRVLGVLQTKMEMEQKLQSLLHEVESKTR